MSSPHEVSVWGAGFGPEGGEWAGVRPAGPTASRRPEPGPEPGPPGRPGSGFSDPKGFESEQEVLEAGGPVLWGREGQPGSATDARGAALDLADESAVAILQQLPDRDVLAVRGYRFPESCAAAHVSAMWAGLEAGPGGGAAPAQSCGEAPLAPAGPLHLGGPRVGRAWGNRKRGARSRSNVAADRQRLPAEGPVGLPSDPEASDEFSEIQLMRVSVYPKEGGQAKPNSPEDPGDTPRHSIFQVRKSFLHVPGAFLSSAPRGFPPVVERQGVGELDISSAKKMQSVLWGKGASRPSYPGAAAAAAAAGGLPRAAPRRKGAQEKKSLGGASRLALGRAFPSWGQQTPAPPLEPATFPPVSGIPLLGRSKRYSLVPLGTKQSKHTGAGKKSVARQARESEAVAGEDNDPNRDPVPKGQLPARRPGPSCWLCMHHGEPSSGDLNTRGPQDPGNSEPLSWNQGEVMPRGPAPSAAQEPLDHPSGPQRRQQPPGTQGCPQCLVLQREIDDLKEQLAAMQYLADKFQIL
ncbi:uncharacterized protein CXorf49 homolog [Hippopotamus amphibius kiboko]|uniref:uncharacterized protein CXorf49 homolog n=1 Tax=Hippopotamus amphibius kiboko TaxID=575201 RepID=UPI00259494BC|nr:uncharacterized protein CXorf49 homolog [Hippopotamus amphibius kiboko]